MPHLLLLTKDVIESISGGIGAAFGIAVPDLVSASLERQQEEEHAVRANKCDFYEECGRERAGRALRECARLLLFFF